MVFESTSPKTKPIEEDTIKEKTDPGTDEIVEEATFTIDNPVDETKKIRKQHLIKCGKCDKWVTEKTLKYSHSIKCGLIKK